MYQSYDEMRRIAIKYYNDNNFCTVIALAVCCNVGIGKAYHAMKRAGRKDRKGAVYHVTYSALHALGYREKVVHNIYGVQVRSITKHLPNKGMFMVHVKGHVLAVRDGVILDWTEGRRHKVLMVNEIVKA
jgi:hypothetical protein